MVVDLAQDFIPIVHRERGIDAPRDGMIGMDPLAAQLPDDLLAEGAETDRLGGEFRIRLDHTYHIPDRGVRVKSQQEVRARQLEKVHRMGLNELTHVHQFAKQPGGSWRSRSNHAVTGLCSGEVMADRADPADSRSDLGHFEVGAALGELLEPPPLIDMHISSVYFSFSVEVDGHLRVTFDPCYRLNRNLLHNFFLLHQAAEKRSPAASFDFGF